MHSTRTIAEQDTGVRRGDGLHIEQRDNSMQMLADLLNRELEESVNG